MRIEPEIESIHNLLGALLQGKYPELEDDLVSCRREMTVAADVLCWVLEHTNNGKFAANIVELSERLRHHGIDPADAMVTPIPRAHGEWRPPRRVDPAQLIDRAVFSSEDPAA